MRRQTLTPVFQSARSSRNPSHSPPRDGGRAEALAAGMQVAQPQLILLRAKPSSDYQTFPWVEAPPPLPPVDTAGAWGEHYRVARVHDLAAGSQRHPLLYGCVVPAASSAPKAVRPTSLPSRDRAMRHSAMTGWAC